MDQTIQEILTFIEEQDVKFIRLAFCDLDGRQKNMSVMPKQIHRVFQEGILFDGSAINGFTKTETSDLLLIPDPSTMDILPWRPQTGRVLRFYCDICYPNKTPYEHDMRALLKQQLKDIKKQGYRVMSGMECEFYLFQKDEHGTCTWIPQDQAGYLDVAPLDRGEDVRRDICLTLEEMGIEPESSHHEQGPGQNEIDFHYAEAITSCDQLITFKWAVEMIAEQHGLHASFQAKPLANDSGSGLHINLSLSKNQNNAFALEPEALLEQFMAGILLHSREMTLFLNPEENSYDRLGEFEAPIYCSWSHANRSALIRVPEVSAEYVRCEVRSGDPQCNPYIATTLLLAAGMEGIQKRLPLMKESKENLYQQSSELTPLPTTLQEAITCASQSKFIQSVLPASVIEYYVESRKQMLHHTHTVR